MQRSYELSSCLARLCLGAHQNHLHIDVGPPTRVTGLANLAGDFNLDDVVDAKDYVVWRANVGKTLTQADYTQFRANFGRSIANRPIAAGADYTAAGLSVGAIPEPATASLALVGMLALIARRSRVTC